MLTTSQEYQIEQSIDKLSKQLERNKERKRQKEITLKHISNLQVLLTEIKDEELEYKQARLFTIKFQNEKRLSDAEAIKTAMSVASALVKRVNNITPEFLHKPGRYPESKLIIRAKNRILSLEDTEGTGVNESVSLTTLLSVLQSTPYAKIALLDEYFSSVSPSNSVRLSEVLNKLIDGQIQLVMIEQKDETVEHANYREFFVRNDGDGSYVETYEVQWTPEGIIRTKLEFEEE